MTLKKTIACLQIALQILPSSFLYFGASSASAQEKVPETQSTEQILAQRAVQAGSLLESDSSRAVASAITSGATGLATNEIQSWLNQFGNARVSISTDEKFSLRDAELDLLLPLYEQEDKLFFTQLGGRRYDDRNIINAGFGYREFNSNWMWGVNTFYDRQISANQHQRLGVGAELGWDYLRLSANGYYRLSDWMASSAYRDYDERVANGFDLRAVGYLPAYPQLGANLVYEQYYGNHVGLFGDDEDDRQKDPYAITFGLNYTPVPLITVGVNQKTGKGGESDTQFNLALNWTPGVPLSTQLDPDQVGSRRTLLGSRQELVNRNNNIVLDYRKQELISLSLPEKIAGNEKARQTVTAKVKSKYGLERVDWQGESLIRNGGKITSGTDPAQVEITLPAWQSSGLNSYQLTATAWDKHGNASNSGQMLVNVNGIDVNTLQSGLVVSPDKLPADGASQSTLTLTLKTASGEAATGLASRLSSTYTLKSAVATDAVSVAPKVSAFRESGNGVYTATLTSGNTPATVNVQALIDGTVKLAAASLIQEATATIAQLASIATSAASVPADGVTPLAITVKAEDQFGNALSGQTIKWQADKPSARLSAAQSTTNEKGEASVQVTSKEVVDTIVRAQLEGGNTLSTPALKFIADIASAQVKAVSADKQRVVANNSDSVTYTAQVRDGSDHPLVNMTVNWAIKRQDGSSIGSKTSVSDSAGNATLSLASARTGVIYVYADVNQQNAVQAESVTFVADTSTQRINSVVANKREAVANGNDTLTYTAQVRDLQGNPISGVAVNWSADNTEVRLADTSTTTDEQGNASLTVTSLKTGNVVITAQTDESAPVRAESTTFIADATTAKLTNISSDKAQAIADGSDVITLRAAAVDANNNPLKGAQVNWEVTPSTATLSGTTSESDSEGMARIALRSTSVGSYRVTATLNGSSLNTSSLDFIANSSTAQIATVSADKTADIVADSDTVTLTATVQDENQHPVSGVTVNWSSSDSAGVTLTPASAVTNAQGQATTRFSSRKAGTVTVSATTNGSSKSQSLTVIGNAATAQFISLTADKNQAVADGNAKITWTATVADANQNLLTGQDVAWSVDNNKVTLSASTTKTDSTGKAVITGSTTTAGAVALTATLASSSAVKQAEQVSFIGDVATARIDSLSAGSDHAVVNTDRIIYTALVKDVNNNLVPNATVNWSTTLNDLSESTSVTDASGRATVKLSGPNTGTARVTAEINSSSKADGKLVFIASYRANWNFSSTTGATTRFETNSLFGFMALGFVATGNTRGPTNMVVKEDGYSTLTVPMTDEQGTTWDVVFRGQRGSNCSVRTLNSTIQCTTWATTGYRAILTYVQEDNPDLPRGVYRGDINFAGKDWYSSWSLDYIVATTLTFN